MLSSFRRNVTFGVLVIGWLSGLCLAAAQSRQVIGEVVRSSGASLGGVLIPGQGTIMTDDLLSTEKGGSALVKLSATTRARLSEQTSVRFQKIGDHTSAQMLSGTMVAERLGKNVLAVETLKYKIEPADLGKAIYLVALLPDKRTVVATRSGRVLITEIRSGQSYLLSEGKYAAIPASSSGVPGRENVESTQDTGGQAGQAPPQPSLELWHIGSLSHSASVALEGAIGAGMGAGVALTIDKTVLSPASSSAP